MTPKPVTVLRTVPPGPLPPRPTPDLDSARFPWWDLVPGDPARGLTPQGLIQIYRAADAGSPSMQCDLFDRVAERDGHLRAQFAIRAAAVAGKTWLLQAGGDNDADMRAAKLLEARLRRVPNLRATFRHLLKHIFYGWSATEIMWEEVDGLFAPAWFANVEHRRFVFDQWGAPMLLTTEERSKGIPLKPGKWIYLESDSRAPSSGLMRTAVWLSLWKSRAFRDWVIFNERFGMPCPIGTYGDATPKEEKDALKQAVAAIGKDFYAIFHESCKIESIKLDGGSAPDAVQGPFVQLCNAEMSKLITGATLTSGEGSSVGSYALGAVHENVLFSATCDDAEMLAEAFAQQVGRPFVEMNGLDAEPPRLKMQVVKEIDPTARAGIFDLAVNKLKVPVDLDQFYQEFQLKAPTGAAIAGAPAPPDNMPPAAPPPAGPPA